MDFKKIFKKKKATDYLIYTLTLFLGILFDVISKNLAVENLHPNKSVVIIEGVLSFTYHENTGAAWGMLKDAPWVFNSISTVAIIAMLIYLYIGQANTRLRAVSIALISSGGIGNMIERLGKGYVVDFIQATFIDFPIFNVADCCVCVGAGLLILTLILEIAEEAKKEKASRSVPEEENEGSSDESEEKE